MPGLGFRGRVPINRHGHAGRGDACRECGCSSSRQSPPHQSAPRLQTAKRSESAARVATGALPRALAAGALPISGASVMLRAGACRPPACYLMPARGGPRASAALLPCACRQAGAPCPQSQRRHAAECRAPGAHALPQGFRCVTVLQGDARCPAAIIHQCGQLSLECAPQPVRELMLSPVPQGPGIQAPLGGFKASPATQQYNHIDHSHGRPCQWPMPRAANYECSARTQPQSAGAG
jgi:hypothetical protein